MLNVIIAETKKAETLKLTNPCTNEDWVDDFIGNNDGFGTSLDDVYAKFVSLKHFTDEDYQKYTEYLDFGDAVDDSIEQYVTSDANFEWWVKVVNSQQELDELVQKAKKLGVADDDIYDALDQPQTDLDDLIIVQTQEISELIEQIKK